MASKIVAGKEIVVSKIAAETATDDFITSLMKYLVKSLVLRNLIAINTLDTIGSDRLPLNSTVYLMLAKSLERGLLAVYHEVVEWQL